VMILDEPFRGLDAMTRELMWEYYSALYEENRRTNFFVTTDIDEAIFLADRLFVSCGVYEPLIIRNRSMVPTFEAAGMTVRYIEARDGHSWENWRDRLREGLSWIFPGPQKFFYE